MHLGHAVESLEGRVGELGHPRSARAPRCSCASCADRLDRRSTRARGARRVDDLARQVDELRAALAAHERALVGVGLSEPGGDGAAPDGFDGEPWTRGLQRRAPPLRRARARRRRAARALPRGRASCPTGSATASTSASSSSRGSPRSGSAAACSTPARRSTTCTCSSGCARAPTSCTSSRSRPRSSSFPQLGVSYLYADLRELPLADATYDRVLSISTLEHVGMDTSYYGGETKVAEDPQRELLAAVRGAARACCARAATATSRSRSAAASASTGCARSRPTQLDEIVAAFAPDVVVDRLLPLRATAAGGAPTATSVAGRALPRPLHERRASAPTASWPPRRSPACTWSGRTDRGPRASVVVVTTVNAAGSTRCLRSLAALARRPAVRDDRRAQRRRGRRARARGRASGVTVVESVVNRGFAGGANLGRAAASGEFVVLLHDDAEAQAGWLSALVRCADEHPEAGAVGSRVLNPDGTLQLAGAVLWRDGTTSSVRGADGDFLERRAVDYAGSSSLLVRAATLGRGRRHGRRALSGLLRRRRPRDGDPRARRGDPLRARVARRARASASSSPRMRTFVHRAQPRAFLREVGRDARARQEQPADLAAAHGPRRSGGGALPRRRAAGARGRGAPRGRRRPASSCSSTARSTTG